MEEESAVGIRRKRASYRGKSAPSEAQLGSKGKEGAVNDEVWVKSGSQMVLLWPQPKDVGEMRATVR